MSKDETLQLALEVLEKISMGGDPRWADQAITAIKEALETKEGLLDRKSYLLGLYDQKPWVGLETKDEPAPVAKNEEGRITWMIDDWPQNCLLYTHPPQSFTYEQVKAHIRAASMSANDISVGSDTTEDGVSIVIRRRDELLYAEFFAYTPPQRTWIGLTQEEFEKLINDAGFTRSDLLMMGACVEEIVYLVEAKLKEKNT